MIEHVRSKTIGDVTPISALHYLLPNPEFGFLEQATGLVVTEEDYNALLWLDSRPQPTWDDIQLAKQLVLDAELAIDLNQIREMRFRETPLAYNSQLYEVSPQALSLLTELIASAEEQQQSSVAVLTFDRRANTISLDDAKELRTLIRKKLSAWVIDPLVP
jgi:hypothetical protein